MTIQDKIGIAAAAGILLGLIFISWATGLQLLPFGGL